jgi:hypothetical protein
MTLFDDVDPDAVPWGRNRAFDGGWEEWHVIGEKLPRIAPVSPQHITPCGNTLNADTMDAVSSPRWSIWQTTEEAHVCPFCREFVQQRAQQKRAGHWPDR